MTRLDEYARVVRSKNAGPLTITLDVMFEDRAAYDRVAQSPGFTAEAIGRLYGVPAAGVEIMPYPKALAIKVSMDRRIVAGDPGDRDVYGAQQHAPILALEV